MKPNISVTTEKNTTFGNIQTGIRGNYDIALRMIELTQATVDFDKGFERSIKQLAASKGIDSYSYPEQLFQFIYNFVKQHVKYIKDNAGNIEHVKNARRTLSDGFGDCEDLSILTASILACFDYKPFFVLANYNANDTTFTHVYTVVYVNGKRFVFDNAYPNGQLNSEAQSKQSIEIGVYDNNNQFHGAKQFLYQGKQLVNKLKNDTLNVVPTLLTYLPTGFGFIATTAINAGLQMVNEQNGVTSLNAIASNIIKQLDEIIVKLVNATIAFDYAKTQAKQIALNLQLADLKPQDKENLPVIAASIKTRLDFINNFPNYAANKNIKLIELNGKLIVVTGLGVAALTAMYLYKNRKF